MEDASSWRDIADYLIIIGIIVFIIIVFEVIRRMSGKKHDIDIPTSNVDLSAGMVADLYKTIQQGDVQNVMAFLDSNPTATNWLFEYREDGFAHVSTLLHLAVQHNKIKTVKLLLLRGADIHKKGGKANRMPLELAIENGSMEMIELLLQAGGKCAPEFLSESHIGEIPTLLREYQSPRVYENIFEAVENYSILGVREFIRKGSDLSVMDAHGQTPLHLAALRGCSEIAKLLVLNGARIHAKNQFGDTPIQVAKAYSNRKIVDMLRLKGGEE